MKEFHFFPQTVVWEVTYACNMRCIHCGTSAGQIRPDELTTEEALGVINDLADLGCNIITISGGEPLLRRDWQQLAAHMYERGISPMLISNGWLVDDQRADQLAAANLKNIGFSYDGTRETHDYIRQREGSHDRVLAAMRRMKERDRPFCGVSQISNINLGELDRMREELLSVGCDLWRVQMTTVTGRMRKDMVLDLDNYTALIDKLLEYMKDESEIRIDVGENIGYYGCKGTHLWRGEPYVGCYAGTRVAGICSNGDVKGCLSMPDEYIEGNIRERSLKEIWNDPDLFAYNRKFTRETAGGACRECQFLPLCRGGCATTSVSATGERANNPFCIYQLEQKQGIEPIVTPVMKKVLKPFWEEAEAETAAGGK